jgi:hypothetical protein
LADSRNADLALWHALAEIAGRRPLNSARSASVDTYPLVCYV